MSNRPKGVAALTKAQILQGRNHTETVPIEALDGEVTIRVLTSGEVEYLKSIPARGIEVSMSEIQQMTGNGRQSNQSGGGNVDAQVRLHLEQMYLAKSEARFKTVALGLTIPDGERWTEDDARNITPIEAVEQIAKEVWRISGVSESDFDVLDEFRTQ